MALMECLEICRVYSVVYQMILCVNAFVLCLQRLPVQKASAVLSNWKEPSNSYRVIVCSSLALSVA